MDGTDDYGLLGGQARTAATPRGSTLEDLERLGLANNPTLKQASAEIEAASELAKQAALYPNHTLSAVGEEIALGPIIRGGEFGGGFQQRIVMGNKLGLSREVGEQDRLAAQLPPKRNGNEF